MTVASSSYYFYCLFSDRCPPRSRLAEVRGQQHHKAQRDVPAPNHGHATRPPRAQGVPRARLTQGGRSLREHGGEGGSHQDLPAKRSGSHIPRQAGELGTQRAHAGRFWLWVPHVQSNAGPCPKLRGANPPRVRGEQRPSII